MQEYIVINEYYVLDGETFIKGQVYFDTHPAWIDNANSVNGLSRFHCLSWESYPTQN